MSVSVCWQRWECRSYFLLFFFICSIFFLALIPKSWHRVFFDSNSMVYPWFLSIQYQSISLSESNPKEIKEIKVQNCLINKPPARPFPPTIPCGPSTVSIPQNHSPKKRNEFFLLGVAVTIHAFTHLYTANTTPRMKDDSIRSLPAPTFYSSCPSLLILLKRPWRPWGAVSRSSGDHVSWWASGLYRWGELSASRWFVTCVVGDPGYPFSSCGSNSSVPNKKSEACRGEITTHPFKLLLSYPP